MAMTQLIIVLNAICPQIAHMARFSCYVPPPKVLGDILFLVWIPSASASASAASASSAA